MASVNLSDAILILIDLDIGGISEIEKYLLILTNQKMDSKYPSYDIIRQ